MRITTEEQAMEKFYEEVADVQLYLKMFDIPWTYIKKIAVKKLARWEQRIKERSKTE